MKTAKNLIKQEDSISYGFNHENKTAIDSNTVKKLMIEYAREAIKADRINVANCASTMEEGNYPFNCTIVDKESIINAPEIELL